MFTIFRRTFGKSKLCARDGATRIGGGGAGLFSAQAHALRTNAPLLGLRMADHDGRILFWLSHCCVFVQTRDESFAETIARARALAIENDELRVSNGRLPFCIGLATQKGYR